MKSPQGTDDVDDLATFSGFLPARLTGRDAGFEWLFGTIAEVFGEARPDTGNRAHAANFITHSDMTELASAQHAAAVLAQIANGILYDGESGEIFSPEELIQMAAETLQQA